jgi:hypothetical protein
MTFAEPRSSTAPVLIPVASTLPSESAVSMRYLTGAERRGVCLTWTGLPVTRSY